MRESSEVVYLDNAATTACAPEVVEAMLPFLTTHFANASSVDHLAGSYARKAVESSRALIAELLSCRPEDVIFTSGATEANNLALSLDGPTVTTRIEHPSILEPFQRRKKAGDRFLGTDKNGLINLSDLAASITSVSSPSLVSVIATNNETGTEQDLAAIGALCAAHGAMLHVDATQALGTRRIILRDGGVAAASLSAHKIHGPKGVGALVARSPLRRLLKPLTRGGGQERGMRPGTLNVAGIVGFGTAAKLTMGNEPRNRTHLIDLRRHFTHTLKTYSGAAAVETIDSLMASPHILSIRFVGVNARALLGSVSSRLAFSLGAACATSKSEPSHVLL